MAHGDAVQSSDKLIGLTAGLTKREVFEAIQQVLGISLSACQFLLALEMQRV